MELLKRNGACFSCLKSGHLSKRCNYRKPCEITDFRQQKCGRFHHPFLHGVIVNASAHHHSVNIVNEEQGKKGVILMISKIESGNIPLTTLWDPGANISLLTFESARKLGLKGREVTLSVTKVGNTSECIQSKEYLLPLTDMYGKVWQVKVYGMNKITADISKVDVHGVVKFFKGIKEGDIVRPEGKVDLLIGADCCILLPEKIDQIGNLQLMRNQFGYCIRGSHAKLHVPVTTESNLVCIHHTSGRIIEPIRLNHESLKNAVDNFFDIEGLGTHCVPKCGSCRCGKCPPGNGSYTLKEERELHLIKEGLQYDEVGKNWTTTYPWIKDPKSLPNNINAAVCRLKCTERRLEKAGQEYSEAYGDQIADMVQRSVARKLTAEEVQRYEGPIHYIPHHEVLKPNSKTTPVRIVFDSSSSYMGHVLNDYWAKGPNVLNDLLGVIIRFRQRKIAIAEDITKMYNAIKLSERDQDTHRFVWRDLQIDRPPDHYVLMSVTFGDKPSGAISTMALRMTAEMNREEYPKAAEFVIKNSYVDDLLTSVNTVCEAKEIILNTERLLSCGGFHVKHWIVSGDQDDHFAGLNVLCAEQENILGMIWLPKDDVWMFKAKLNFSPKRRGKHTEDDIEDGQLHLIPDSLTRKMVLSQVAGIYDPLGLVAPYVLSAKILMRTMCSKENQIGWDEPMSEDMRAKWVQFFTGFYDLQNLTFKRCLMPENTESDPMLVIFSDGSQQAYGACAYIRWHTEDDKYTSSLVIAKNRIAPAKQLSTPRLELCGAVLASRLRQKLVTEMNFKFSKIVHIVDSMIVRAQIQRESYGFGTFVATRVAEIQSTSDPTEWWWVQGDQNPADMTTRVAVASALGTDSKWQNGPDFLRTPFEF
ncbi:uncharacterized protein LOC134264167 [Saccostrea cucullata]|uniref:uncharacterized protein LOC134264167 n=1 Tax=Saccostrea cuccullata TaxID=36930 RepID=UPI002ED55133